MRKTASDSPFKTKIVQFLLLVICTGLVGGCAHSPTNSEETEQSIALIEAFKQGDEMKGAGNCASIAAVKAAMCQYGETGWRQSVEPLNEPEGAVLVALRDGRKLKISPKAIECAASESFLGGPKPELLMQEVHLAFATIAANLAGHDLSKVFEDPECLSAKDVSGGMNTYVARKHLGIPSTEVTETKQASPLSFLGGARRFIGSKPACVAGSSNHAWFVSHRLADKDGSPTRMFSGLNWFGRSGGGRLSHAYCYTETKSRCQTNLVD